MALGATALDTIVTGLFCSHPAEVSLLDALYLTHGHQGILRLMSVQGGNQHDRVRGGAQAIADRIHARLGDAVRLSSPVRQIKQDGGGVAVVADTVTVRARRAIVTIPPALSGHLRYDPPLPAERALLVQRVPGGSVIKVLVMYDEPFWQAEGLTGQSFAVTDPIGATYDGCTDTGTPGLLIAFAGLCIYDPSGWPSVASGDSGPFLGLVSGRHDPR